ncbi:MAG: hypothetical protein HRT47_13170 [Candidatus Caenarcaniphilales bacterium]|nr:hypothetical protein [Candidatus Caenarcaniphilales bacterium]
MNGTLDLLIQVIMGFLIISIFTLPIIFVGNSFYKQKKKLGKLDPNKSFLENFFSA